MSKERDVEQAIRKLKSFREGEQGILDVIACGGKAIPALRRMLFEREPSGLFQVRCRVVAALAALKAHEVLIDFLEADRGIADPVERLGEDAVINCAARALANVRERRALEVLLVLASRPALTGVIAALGALKKAEAIPVLIDALEDDASRATAESALKKLGSTARNALLAAASSGTSAGQQESESRRRQRRSALRVLARIGVPRKAWPNLKPLVYDPDAKLAVLACQIGLAHAPQAERAEWARRLIELLAQDDWMLREDIERCLLNHFHSARQEIKQYLESSAPVMHPAATLQIVTILRRVIARAQAVPP
jgi:HEAT repeat protein